ncbi:hypothetical protein CMV_022206 [Castanea mollissima]|uniref:Uncharacterized protein n=1 Tax=Castanea mollissima TaxID=60419 RepID=A0A8J4QJZ4_9ROSI|nr:hypothetical protein CMV_022206 [Castanea mollissima]
MGVAVGGVILDESLLLASNSPQHENPSLQPVADSLLRKLRHSKIPTGISCDVGLSDDKVSLLKRLATLYSFDCFILNESSVDDAKNEIMLAWGDTGGSILYVVSDKKKEFFPKLSNCGWLIVVLRSLGQESAAEVPERRNLRLIPSLALPFPFAEMSFMIPFLYQIMRFGKATEWTDKPTVKVAVIADAPAL